MKAKIQDPKASIFSGIENFISNFKLQLVTEYCTAL